jgi:hypothetical protein
MCGCGTPHEDNCISTRDCASARWRVADINTERNRECIFCECTYQRKSIKGIN